MTTRYVLLVGLSFASGEKQRQRVVRQYGAWISAPDCVPADRLITRRAALSRPPHAVAATVLGQIQRRIGTRKPVLPMRFAIVARRAQRHGDPPARATQPVADHLAQAFGDRFQFLQEPARNSTTNSSPPKRNT